MGGGDLNQKKSWHPHTIKNQEKVWKAEQAKSQEEKKLRELQKEISDERNREDLRRIGESSGVLAKTDADKKLEWMYKSSAELVNRDEYLLGRTIDKTFETLQAEEHKKDANVMGVKQPINHVEHECIPFSIRDYRNLASGEQVDLQRKQMEDPLMLIKQREMESRRKLLENPVKLKELHRILKTDQQLSRSKKGKKSKSKKSKKSKKKHKKRNKSSSDSDTSDSGNSDKDLDAQLAKKYNKIKGSLLEEGSEFKNMSLTKLLDAKYETISKELDKAVKTKRRHQNSSDESDSIIKDKRSHEQKSRKKHERSRSAERRNDRSLREGYRRRSYSRNRGQKRELSDRNRRKRSRSREYKRHQDEKVTYKFDRQARRSPVSADKTRIDPPMTQKLTEEEKEARRREMMENAEWRESDRTKAVKRHREAYEKEEKQNREQDFDKNFINKEVKKAIGNHSSIESRIRSNLNNIQRTTSAMDSNFARK